MSIARPFIGINHGKGQIDLNHLDNTDEFLPIEIHMREDGTTDNKPSVAIVLKDGGGRHVYGQLSLKMWNEGLKDIGYKIVKL